MTYNSASTTGYIQPDVGYSILNTTFMPDVPGGYMLIPKDTTYTIELDTGSAANVISNVISGITTGVLCKETDMAYKEMFDIKDVKAIHDKVVIVEFGDGTTQKAVCRDGDAFSLETGISICLTKRILSLMFKNGHSEYNKLIRKAMRVYTENREREAKAEQKRIEEKQKEKRIAEKRKLQKQRKLDAERERAIDIQAEAYRRAAEAYHIAFGDSKGEANG